MAHWPQLSIGEDGVSQRVFIGEFWHGLWDRFSNNITTFLRLIAHRALALILGSAFVVRFLAWIVE